MKVLLTFFLVVFLLAARATRRGKPMRAWPLVIASVVVAATFLSQRVI